MKQVSQNLLLFFARREKLDIVIVVDMLLTGFDSKYLNTLYVDKTLKHHGLIQAFSRTNRMVEPGARQTHYRRMAGRAGCSAGPLRGRAF